MEIVGIYFLGTIVPRKYMPKISAVGLFCCDKFEETPNEKVSNMSKLSKSYFSPNYVNLDMINTFMFKNCPYLKQSKLDISNGP